VRDHRSCTSRRESPETGGAFCPRLIAAAFLVSSKRFPDYGYRRPNTARFNQSMPMFAQIETGSREVAPCSLR
jgi:hypothetical protein